MSSNHGRGWKNFTGTLFDLARKNLSGLHGNHSSFDMRRMSFALLLERRRVNFESSRTFAAHHIAVDLRYPDCAATINSSGYQSKCSLNHSLIFA